VLPKVIPIHAPRIVTRAVQGKRCPILERKQDSALGEETQQKKKPIVIGNKTSEPACDGDKYCNYHPC
jgi:hypothetical protein